MDESDESELRFKTQTIPSMENFLQQFVTAEENGELVYSGDELVVSEAGEDEAVDAPGDESALFRLQRDEDDEDEDQEETEVLDQSKDAFQAKEAIDSQDALMALSNEHERYVFEQEEARYLKRARVIDQSMQSAEMEVQERLDAMKRIMDISDPMEQLSEYLAMLLEERSETDIEIVTELVHCARHLPPEDVEVVLFAAFFFLCDGNRTRNRGMIAMLPVVAAMLEASGGVSHPF